MAFIILKVKLKSWLKNKIEERIPFMAHRILVRALPQTPALASKEEQRTGAHSQPRRSCRFAKRNMGPQPRTTESIYMCIPHPFLLTLMLAVPWTTLLEVGLAIFHRLASLWTIQVRLKAAGSKLLDEKTYMLAYISASVSCI